jgi:hypothetical protein
MILINFSKTTCKSKIHKTKISYPFIPTLQILTGSRGTKSPQTYKVHLIATNNDKYKTKLSVTKRVHEQ